MVELYKIKTENENKVLYLYLNYDYEFGRDINDKVLKTIKREIDIFNIAKIVLIIGGVTFSTIYIKDNYNFFQSNNRKNIIDDIVMPDFENTVAMPKLEHENDI